MQTFLEHRLSDGDLHFDKKNSHSVSASAQHEQTIANAGASLAERYSGCTVVVATGLRLCWRVGPQTKSLVPDLFVVKDHTLRRTSSYRIWDEGRTPDFVLEVLSPSTRTNDEGDLRKKGRYRRLGIKEYFLIQPNPYQPGPYRTKPNPENPAARLEA